MCKGLFGSPAALLLTGGYVAAQAPAIPAGATPAEAVEASPSQQAVPGSAEGSLPPSLQAPSAVAPGEDGTLSGCEPSFSTSLLSGGVKGSSFFVGADYLLWWTKGQFLPSLATFGSPMDSPPGAFGQPSTVQIIGNTTADNKVRSGGLFTLGSWINQAQTIGLEGSVFFLQPQSSHYAVNSDGISLLAVPFFAVGTITNPDGSTTNLSMEDALVVGTPGTSVGTVAVTTSNHFWGAEANALLNVCRDCSFRVDLLAGFRYLELMDQLSIATDSMVLPPTDPMGVSTFDSFNTRNRFYGLPAGPRKEIACSTVTRRWGRTR